MSNARAFLDLPEILRTLMIKNYVASVIRQQFAHKPTPEQETVIEQLTAFMLSPTQDELFLLKGYAGTGKTTLVSALINALEAFQLRAALLAPTGRAAKVLSNYAGKAAYTIHKRIYRQKSAADGFGSFVLDRNLFKNTLFFVDEASMIANTPAEAALFGTGRLLDDLIQYVYSGTNCKLILIGDTAQLPPVKLALSPALDKARLDGYGKEVFEFEMKQVVRQTQESGILFNATKLRQQIATPSFQKNYPKFELQNFSDVKKIQGEELIEEISDAYSAFGLHDCMVVCRSNRRANRYNQGIRNSILWREEEIATEDLLMVVKNNYFWTEGDESLGFIANGDIVEIVRIVSYQERYGYRFADVSLRFADYHDIEIEAKIMLDTLWLETASLEGEKMRELFSAIEADYADEPNKKKRYQKVRNNPFFNALQVKFAYAITCHKAQGGQWKAVFLDQGYLTDDMLNTEYLRWLYTAFTRATEKLFLVNFKDDFFID